MLLIICQLFMPVAVVVVPVHGQSRMIGVIRMMPKVAVVVAETVFLAVMVVVATGVDKREEQLSVEMVDMVEMMVKQKVDRVEMAVVMVEMVRVHLVELIKETVMVPVVTVVKQLDIIDT